MTTKTVFTTGEAAKICKVSQQTIIRCFDNGTLKGFRVPGSRFRRIPRDQLFSFMRDNGIPTDALESGKRKALIVDDDPELVELISDGFERDGRFDIRTANNGFDAGMLVKEFRPDLVVLDVMLPDINGREVCQRVRSDPSLEAVRIICISGMVEQDKIAELRASGANDFLQKPFTVDRLIDRACDLLEIERAAMAQFAQSMSDRTGMAPADVDRESDRESGATGSRADSGRRAEHDRLLALRDFAYGASHELNNPLANIVSRAESLLRDEADGERRRKLAAIVSQAYRAHEMIADLMLYARPPALKLAPVRASDLLAAVVQELRDEADELNVTLVVDCEPELTFPGDADQLAAALRAVGRNAIEASIPGGRVEFAADKLSSDSDGQPPAIRFCVTDNGRGFAPVDRDRLFHPYHSGREAGRGLGLGLCKAWRIVDEHGGAIDLARTPNNETQLTINLPRN